MDSAAPPALRAPVNLPPWPVVDAPSAWRCVDFVSDLHLDAAAPQTFLAWRHYLSHTPADAVFILGDLFEVWVGDDAADPGSFEARCARALRKASGRCALFFLSGNRDFLLGNAFARASGLQRLEDPTVLAYAGRRWLLSHGDTLCLDDTDYLAFHRLVRSASWQLEFLAQALPARREQARLMRERSETRKKSAPRWIDADDQEACAWLRASDCTTLIHGHTHQPADHAIAPGLQRVVLSDWDQHAEPPRGQVLRITSDGQVRRLGVHRESMADG